MPLILKLWQAVPSSLQLSIVKTAQRNKRVYRWLMFRHFDLKDQANGNLTLLPPAEMRYRVGGSPDPEEFVTIGKQCAADIQAALQKVGRELDSFERILDFGCGCGRTLVHMKSLAPNAQFEGTDIDANAIEWCRQHLKFGRFTLSKESPPIDYAAGTFDLIYVISVFTHLDEDYQFRWLEELQRIAKPGAILVVSVNGSKTGEGFLFERSYEEGLFPAWYQNTYHSKEYVYENFGKYFEVLAHLPRSLNAHQDLVVLQKRK
jgi:cyclopropane fatty-acyl-phospholipid synthase-like methyltransferase